MEQARRAEASTKVPRACTGVERGRRHASRETHRRTNGPSLSLPRVASLTRRVPTLSTAGVARFGEEALDEARA